MTIDTHIIVTVIYNKTCIYINILQVYLLSVVCCHEMGVYYNTNALFGNYIYIVLRAILESYIVVPCTQEVIIHVILFIGAIVALLRNISIPIPRGMVKVMINISLCWSCFCCCVCCSQRCKEKALMKVLIMFSFMMFIHRNIMDVISFTFMMFIERSRVIIITIAFLYISLMIFLILSVSFSLFIMLNGSNAGMSICQQMITFLGGVCTLISVFGAVALIVVYMIAFFSLNLKGVTGIVTGLIPTIALSAASWYIKKRLLERALNRPHTSDQPECGATNNDGEVENDQRLLIP